MRQRYPVCFLFLFFTLCFPVASWASAEDVFLQRDDNGIPVRWPMRDLVITVSPPEQSRLQIGRTKLAQLLRLAAKPFNEKIDISILVRATGKTNETPQMDGVNQLALRRYPACKTKQPARPELCADENRYGRTRLYPARNISTEGYRPIVEADIELNVDAFTEMSGEKLEEKLIVVLRHELGHFLGLAHNCVASAWYASQYKGSTSPPVCDNSRTDHISPLMYPLLAEKNRHQSRLSQQELETLRSVYPDETIAGQDKQFCMNGWLIALTTGIGVVALLFFIAFRRRRMNR